MLTHASKLAKPRDLDACQGEHARLLVVRHGIHRGPQIRLRFLRPARYQPMFNDIANRFPRLGRSFDFWETGNPPPDLTNVRAVVFILQDPLRELYADCFADASALAAKATELGIRVVNPPESLSNTIKSTQSRLWIEAGIPTPPCVGFSEIDQLYDAAQQLDVPFIVKSDRLHAQKRMLICADVAELRQIPRDRIPIQGVVSPVIDTREGWQAVDPQSPYATHYHKKRAMIFGSHVCNNHVFFADHPIVGCVSSTFGHYRSFNPIKRMLRNARYQSHFDCDLQFWGDEPDQPQVLLRAARVLGVEICAIDYSIKADGQLVLWEANPFFSLHMWPLDVLGRKRQLPQRMPKVHDTAAMFFVDLLETPS